VAQLHGASYAIVPSAARVDEGEIEAALQGWLSERGLAGDEEVALLSAEAELLAGLELEQILEILRNTPPMSREQNELWERIRESGRIDEVIAELERQAAADPTSPDAQVAVGGALLQKLLAEPGTTSMFELAEAADEAFDRALELDETHWIARFTKAIALSRQPAFMGKSGEAIEQFEILVEQQARGAPLPEHAQVHLYLGSLYQQTGSASKALEAWRRGLALFPDDPRLRAQVELHDASLVE
jgi:tetratricopeptide (TPR) repeat protein